MGYGRQHRRLTGKVTHTHSLRQARARLSHIVRLSAPHKKGIASPWTTPLYEGIGGWWTTFYVYVALGRGHTISRTHSELWREATSAYPHINLVWYNDAPW